MQTPEIKFGTTYRFTQAKRNPQVKFDSQTSSEEMSVLMTTKEFQRNGGLALAMNPQNGDVFLTTNTRENEDGSAPRASILRDARLLNHVAILIDQWTANGDEESKARESVNALLVKASTDSQTTYTTKEREIGYKVKPDYVFNCYMQDGLFGEEPMSEQEIESYIL